MTVKTTERDLEGEEVKTDLLRYDRFQTFAAIVLGTITGLLISFPIAIGSTGSHLGLWAFLAGGGAGALVGYRRRGSRGFLYFCFVTILVLSGTISSSLLPQ